MFMLTSNHRAILTAFHEAAAQKMERMRETQRHALDAEAVRVERLKQSMDTSNRTSALFSKRVDSLLVELKASQECSEAQANIIKENNRRLTNQAETIRFYQDRDRANQAGRKCAMEEKIFQQLGALLAEKPVDHLAEVKVLKDRAARASGLLSGLGGYYTNQALRVLKGEV